MKPTAAPASADGQGASSLPEGAAALARCPSTRVVAPLWAVTVLAAMAGAALTLVARDNLAMGDLASNLALSVTAYATLGALIVRRAGNRIGWIMLGAGAAQALLAIASVYAVIGLATFPGSLPAAKQAGTLAECSFPAVVFTVAFMFLLFPTGTLPSRRWRPVAAAGLMLAAPTTAGLVIHPRMVALLAALGHGLRRERTALAALKAVALHDVVRERWPRSRRGSAAGELRWSCLSLLRRRFRVPPGRCWRRR